MVCFCGFFEEDSDFKKCKIRVLKNLEAGFRCRNLIFLQHKCQIRNQREKLHIVTHSDMFNSKIFFFQNLTDEVSRYVDKPYYNCT